MVTAAGANPRADTARRAWQAARKQTAAFYLPPKTGLSDHRGPRTRARQCERPTASPTVGELAPLSLPAWCSVSSETPKVT